MSELKACPFCGHEPKATHDGKFVACLNEQCVSIRPTNWNTRPLEDALTARIAELEGALKKITITFFEDGSDETAANRMLNIAQEVLK